MSRTFVNAALRYAALGWPVFPCAPRSKVPLVPNPHPPGDPARYTCRGYRDCGRLGHGVLDATTDPRVIAGLMWRRNPRANIGIACGWPGPDVVDVDIAHGKPGRASFLRLREAGLLRGAHAVVRTPTGGRHLYFAGREGGQGNGALAAYGIDLRSAGGYVVAPPSVTPAGRYAFTRYRPPTGYGVDFAAIRELLDPPRPRPALSGSAGDYTALVRWMSGQREGNRNNALFWAACRAAETGAAPDVLADLVDAAVGTGLPLAEAERTVESATVRQAYREPSAGVPPTRR